MNKMIKLLSPLLLLATSASAYEDNDGVATYWSVDESTMSIVEEKSYAYYPKFEDALACAIWETRQFEKSQDELHKVRASYFARFASDLKFHNNGLSSAPRERMAEYWESAEDRVDDAMNRAKLVVSPLKDICSALLTTVEEGVGDDE
ncbi:hypothetical protein GR7B_00008 [Vibrio phage vB_VcorM_GR7B]|nr:hypothetical protein GR7B_00008 [Vibrio phage vB_VcorM_GR7B]